MVCSKFSIRVNPFFRPVYGILSSQLAAPQYCHSRLLFQSRLPITSKNFETPVPICSKRENSNTYNIAISSQPDE